MSHKYDRDELWGWHKIGEAAGTGAIWCPRTAVLTPHGCPITILARVEGSGEVYAGSSPCGGDDPEAECADYLEWDDGEPHIIIRRMTSGCHHPDEARDEVIDLGPVESDPGLFDEELGPHLDPQRQLRRWLKEQYQPLTTLQNRADEL